MKRVFTMLCFYGALSAQVVQNGLVAHFRMDGNAADASPLGVDGTTFSTVPTIGKNGGTNTALLFNPAIMSRIDATTNSRNITSNVTFSAWIKTTSSAIMQVMDKYDYTVDAGFYMATDNGKVLIGGRNGSGTFLFPGNSITTINDGQWHWVCGVINGNSWQLWVDCNLEQSLTATASTPTLACSFPLVMSYSTYGATVSDPRYFDGSIDEARVYNRALSTLELDSICAFTEPFIGITEYGEDIDFEIYPNPTNDFVSIKDFNSNNFKISIYNSLGEVVLTAINKTRLDISTLMEGAYFMVLRDFEKNLIGKRKLMIISK